MQKKKKQERSTLFPVYRYGNKGWRYITDPTSGNVAEDYSPSGISQVKWMKTSDDQVRDFHREVNRVRFPTDAQNRNFGFAGKTLEMLGLKKRFISLLNRQTGFLLLVVIAFFSTLICVFLEILPGTIIERVMGKGTSQLLISIESSDFVASVFEIYDALAALYKKIVPRSFFGDILRLTVFSWAFFLTHANRTRTILTLILYSVSMSRIIGEIIDRFNLQSHVGRLTNRFRSFMRDFHAELRKRNMKNAAHSLKLLRGIIPSDVFVSKATNVLLYAMGSVLIFAMISFLLGRYMPKFTHWLFDGIHLVTLNLLLLSVQSLAMILVVGVNYDSFFPIWNQEKRDEEKKKGNGEKGVNNKNDDETQRHKKRILEEAVKPEKLGQYANLGHYVLSMNVLVFSVFVLLNYLFSEFESRSAKNTVSRAIPWIEHKATTGFAEKVLRKQV